MYFSVLSIRTLVIQSVCPHSLLPNMFLRGGDIRILTSVSWIVLFQMNLSFWSSCSPPQPLHPLSNLRDTHLPVLLWLPHLMMIVLYQLNWSLWSSCSPTPPLHPLSTLRDTPQPVLLWLPHLMM